MPPSASQYPHKWFRRPSASGTCTNNLQRHRNSPATHRPQCRLKRGRTYHRFLVVRADGSAASHPLEGVGEPRWRQQLQALLHSEHDALIIGLALPALGSILLDPIMSMVDTGALHTYLPGALRPRLTTVLAVARHTFTSRRGAGTQW